MSKCAHCVTGITHQGTPVGTIKQINGHDTYVSLPQTSYPKDKAVLLLPDIFGIQFINCKLLADDFARSGLPVYAPDYLNGDPAPEPNPEFDIKKWLKNHGPEKTRPVLDDVVKALKTEGIKEFAAIGYCFGGRYVFDLAFDNVIKVAATCHPSFLQVPEDHHKLLQSSNAPLLINAAEVDQQYPIESQLKGDEILGGGKYKPGYKRIFWAGTTHGFAVRGDLNNPEVKKAKEGAFKATVDFFHEYLYKGLTSSKL